MSKYDELKQLRTLYPAVDVLENAEGFLLRADLPGVSAEDLNLELENGQLTIAGHRAVSEDGYVTYARQFHVPRDTDPEAVRARFVSGVLHIELPKAEARKPRRIAVNAG